MASKRIFDAMEAKDWNKVKDLIAATSWTPQALEKKHGVRTELAPLGNDIPSQYFYLKISVATTVFLFNFSSLSVFSCFMVCVFFFCTYIHRTPHIQGDLPSYLTFHVLTY